MTMLIAGLIHIDLNDAVCPCLIRQKTPRVIVDKVLVRYSGEEFFSEPSVTNSHIIRKTECRQMCR